MSTAATAAPDASPGLHLRVRAETIRLVVLWLLVFSGSIVMIEPSPYEVMILVAAAVWMVGGLRLGREHIIPAVLVVLYLIGASISLIPVITQPKTVTWTLVGWFLAFTGLFYAMVLSHETKPRLDTIVSATIATGVVCSIIGILAIFRLIPSADSFLLYGRLKSTFEDPNVVSAFLVFPAVVLFQRLYIRGALQALPSALALAVISVAIFLSFSRGGWGHLIFSVGLMSLLTFIASRSATMRVRIILVSLLGIGLIVATLAVLLTIPSIGEQFADRFSLDQSYDEGRFGRFGRHALGFALALERPIGVGMLQFYKIFGEDPHNTYLNAFMSYGWLGGLVWPAIVVATLVAGYRTVLVPAPWRPVFICVLATYQGLVLEAWIIDIDHWRHGWLLFGAVWGLSTASMRWKQRAI